MSVVFDKNELLYAVPHRSTSFCTREGCGRTIVGGQSPEVVDLCEECGTAGIWLPKSLSSSNKDVDGQGSGMSIFTPTGEYPSDLHVKPQLSDWERTSSTNGANPTLMVPRRPPIRQHLTLVPISRQLAPVPSLPSWTPQPSHFNSRGEVIFVTFGHVSIDNGSKLLNQPSGNSEKPAGCHLPQNCTHCHVPIPKFSTSKLCGNCHIQNMSVGDVDNSPVPPVDMARCSDLKTKEVVEPNRRESISVAKESVNPGTEISRPIRIKLRVKPINPLTEPVPDRTPTKRRRLIDEHTQALDLTRASSPEQISESCPQTTAGKHNGLRRNKPSKALDGLCPTTGCTGLISANSSARRCMGCVKLEWKQRKEHLKLMMKSREPRHSSCTQTVGEPNSTTIAKIKPRKSVTWADMVTEASEHGEVTHRPALYVNEESSDSESDNDLQDLKVDNGRPDGLQHVPGWDSDLSDLTDTDESDSSDNEARISAPTGLKIRIPPRPRNVYSRKCRNTRCSQRLATTYPEETCVVCRARMHRRQRRQQNPYFWQDWSGEDLWSDPETVMPLEFLRNNDSLKPLVVPNARVCSTTECNYIIAPHEEYNRKTCALCRLYQREWRLARKQKGPSVEPQVNTKEQLAPDAMVLFSLLENLPTKRPGQGRCRSIDCGFLVDDSSIICRQCVTRRAKLMRKAGIFDEKPNEVVGKTPSEIISYPQYTCSAVLLTDFGDRLSTFLKSQTIFFLFNSRYPESSHANTLFAFDGEYSVVAIDFDIIRRKRTIDSNAVKLKKEFERVGRIKFTSKRMVSILEGGGLAIRFMCSHRASILSPAHEDGIVALAETGRQMQGELEIAVFPDHSHRFLPGEKTIIRFRLFG